MLLFTLVSLFCIGLAELPDQDSSSDRMNGREFKRYGDGGIDQDRDNRYLVQNQGFGRQGSFDRDRDSFQGSDRFQDRDYNGGGYNDDSLSPRDDYGSRQGYNDRFHRPYGGFGGFDGTRRHHRRRFFGPGGPEPFGFGPMGPAMPMFRWRRFF